MTWDDLQRAATERHLTLLGALETTAQDNLGDVKTLVLLGPAEPEFWDAVQNSPEWRRAHPIDSWSRRVVDTWAKQIGATAFYPFDGPPWHPFLDWGRRTGRIDVSPVGMLVHDTAGLFVSFRAALGLPHALEGPAAPSRICETCTDKPCLTACPVDALQGATYAAETCKSHLRDVAGQDCVTQGCRARRACPISKSWGRRPEQSAYHMRRFLEG